MEQLKILECPDCQCHSFYIDSKARVAYLGDRVYIELKKLSLLCSDCDEPLEMGAGDFPVSLVKDIKDIVVRCKPVSGEIGSGKTRRKA
jgi:Zn finger protein HypA/HybF involved in hydrogenase expression